MNFSKLLASVLLVIPVAARPDTITYSWTGVVNYFYTSRWLPRHDIEPGSLVSGVFNFDTAVDLTPRPDNPHASSVWPEPLMQMNIENTGWSVSADVQVIWLDISDDRHSQPYREYLLTSEGQNQTPWDVAYTSDSSLVLWLSERRRPEDSHVPPFNLTDGNWTYGHDLVLSGVAGHRNQLWFELRVEIQDVKYPADPFQLNVHVPDAGSTATLLLVSLLVFTPLKAIFPHSSRNR